MTKVYPIPDWLYDVLKWLGLVLLPALATLYGIIAPTWGLPYADQIVTTINAIGVFIGAIIGVSHLTAKEVEDA